MRWKCAGGQRAGEQRAGGQRAGGQRACGRAGASVGTGVVQRACPAPTPVRQ